MSTVADGVIPEPWHKRLELRLRLFFGALAVALFARPWQRAAREAALRRCRKVLLVRIDDRVGEALLTTPVLESLRAAAAPPEVHLLVHARVARVLEGHPAVDRLIPFDRRSAALGPLSPAIRALRAERYDVVVNCASWHAPSVTPAIVARLAARGSGAVVGPAVAPISGYHSHPVPARTDTTSEVEQRVHLLAPLPGIRKVHRLSFRPPVVGPQAAGFLGGLVAPYAVLNPGGRLDWRRIPVEVFAAAGEALAAEGVRAVVTWGPGEEPLAAKLHDRVPGAVLAPATTIDELAALMQRAQLVVCNNTGPMHLSVAVGTPTVAFFLLMDVQRWGHPRPPHRMVDLTVHRGDPEAQKRAAREAVVAVARAGRAEEATHG